MINIALAADLTHAAVLHNLANTTFKYMYYVYLLQNKLKNQIYIGSKAKKGAGFTLIEVSIYIAIIGIVVSSFITFALSINSSRAKTYVVQEVQANTRTTLDLISQKIRLADDVVNPGEGNSASSLELDMPNPDPNLTFIITEGVLGIAEGVGDPLPITSDEVYVSNLTFTNLTAVGEKDNIRVEITIEYRGDGSKEYEYSQSLQTAVSLRK